METSGEFIRKTTQLDNDVQEIWDRLDLVIGTQTAHSSRFDRVDLQLTSIGATVRRHDSRFMEIGHDLGAIKMQQVLHGDQLARQADKLALHAIQLERHSVILDEHSDKLDGLTEQVTQLDRKVAQLDGKVTQLDGKVTQLDGKVTQLDGKVTQLDGKVSQMAIRLETVASQLGQLMHVFGVDPPAAPGAPPG